MTSSELWRKLNGIFCIYKPSEKYIMKVKNLIINNLITDLNALYVPPDDKFISIEGLYSYNN